MLVIGYPKSGNTWFCFLLAYCLNVPYDNLMEPGIHPREEWQRRLVKGGLPHKSFLDKTKGVWSTHNFDTFKQYLGKDYTIYLVRDGRDVMVSYYYYLNKFLVEEKRNRKKGVIARILGGANEPDADEDYPFLDFVRERGAEWKKEVLRCLKEKPGMLVRYEELNRAPEKALRDIFDNFGLDVEQGVIVKALEEFNFKKMSGREKGNEDSTSFFRKGIVGDWREKFGEEERKCFKEVAGDLLVELGYEKDMNW